MQRVLFLYLCNMKYRKSILFFTSVMLNLFQQLPSFAQNLVPNPSFEIINAPPDTVFSGYCYLYTGGFSPPLSQEPPWDTPTNGSPDPYNICSHPISSASIPMNWAGYQQPHSGNGYAAQAFYLGSYREYIQVELDTPLVAGNKYCASFYVNRADSSKLACNNFGMYFSTTHTFIANQLPLPFIPQINDTNIVTDSTGWTLVYGQYEANGGERYIIIGNFYSDSLTDTIQVFGHPHTYQQNLAYYFIDDVSVFEMKKAYAGRDTTICHGDSVQLGMPACLNISYSWQPTGGLSNPNISNPKASPQGAAASTAYYLTETTPCGVSKDTVVVTLGNCWAGVGELNVGDIEIYPNPVTNALTLEIKDNKPLNAKMEIKDVLGQLVYSSKIVSSKTNIDITTYPKGVYFVELQSQEGILRRKLVKE